jgi:hypothetical protein
MSPEGLNALVWLPDSITYREEDAPRSRHADVYARVPGSASEDVPAQMEHSLRVGGYLPVSGLHRPAHAHQTPHSIAATQPDTPEAFTPAQHPAAATSVQDADAAAAQGSLTTSGLPMRIPQANRISGSAGLEQNEAPQYPQPPATRSAEAARARLSGLQRGTRRAEQQVTRAGERTDQERTDH